MTKELEGFKSGNLHRFTQKGTKKIYQIIKRLAMVEYMDSGSRHSLPFVTDFHSKWIDVYKKHTYSNGWPKERPHWSEKTP